MVAGCGGDKTTETKHDDNKGQTPFNTRTNNKLTDGAASDGESDSQSARLVGYYPHYGLENYAPENIPLDRLSHLHYAFAEITADGNIIDRDDDHTALDALRPYARRRSDTKFLVSVRGEFSRGVSTSEKRERFTRSAIKFVDKFNFDGIDIDWEFPTGEDSSNDPKNHALLLNSLRREFENADREYVLSIAGGNSAWNIDPYHVENFAEVIDYVNVMTYDYAGEWQSLTGFNAPLYANPIGPSDWSVHKAMQYWIQQPINPEKLVMGLPFYGRVFTGVRAENNGLNQPYDEVSTIGLAELLQRAEEEGWEKHRHRKAEVPWLYSAEKDAFATYDDITSINNKVKYEREEGLGGAMIWEITQDPTNELLAGIDRWQQPEDRQTIE
jgi:chitinase